MITQDNIEWWLDLMEIKNYTVNPDLTVDVANSVDLKGKNLAKIPVQFNKVLGDFDCSYNLLKSLKGSPIYLEGDFKCNNNQINTLKHSPRHVGQSFDCSSNSILTLKYLPTFIGRNISCQNMGLISLQGAPTEVKGYFLCSYNELTSLEDSPKIVVGFSCATNKLTSLKGCPEIINNYMIATHNDIQTLDYLPQNATEIHFTMSYYFKGLEGFLEHPQSGYLKVPLDVLKKFKLKDSLEDSLNPKLEHKKIKL